MALRRGPRPGGGCCRAPLRATGGSVRRLLPVEVQMAGDGRPCGSRNSIPGDGGGFARIPRVAPSPARTGSARADRPGGTIEQSAPASIDGSSPPDRSKSQAATRGPSRARVPGPVGTEVIDDGGGAPTAAMGLPLGPSGTSMIDSWWWWSSATGSSLCGTGICLSGPDRRSWRSSPRSEQGSGESTA